MRTKVVRMCGSCCTEKESTNKRCFDCNLLSSQICVILLNTRSQKSGDGRFCWESLNIQRTHTQTRRNAPLDLPRNTHAYERVRIIIIIITSANTLRLISAAAARSRMHSSCARANTRNARELGIIRLLIYWPIEKCTYATHLHCTHTRTHTHTR